MANEKACSSKNRVKKSKHHLYEDMVTRFYKKLKIESEESSIKPLDLVNSSTALILYKEPSPPLPDKLNIKEILIRKEPFKVGLNKTLSSSLPKIDMKEVFAELEEESRTKVIIIDDYEMALD